jgi:hypothetical protein
MKKKIIAILVILAVIIVSIIGIIKVKSDKSYTLEKVEKYSYFKLYKNEKYGVIDTDGNIIIECLYDVINIPNPSKPIFFCYDEYDEITGEYRTKVLNEKNEEIFTEYEQVLPIMCEQSTSEIPFEKSVLKYKENGKYGLINFNGKKITKAIYDEIESLEYKEGCLIVKQNDKYGLINIKGKQIIKAEYDEIKSDGYYTEQNEYMDSGFIVQIKTSEGYRYGYIDKNGKVLLETEYNEINRITEIEDNENIYLLAMENGKQGVVKNKKNILKYEYEEIEYNKTNKVFIVQKNSKQGVINIEGDTILETNYDYIYCSQNTIIAQKDDDIENYNLNGEKQEDTNYESKIQTTNENYIITINKDDEFGVINKNNEVLINDNYQYIEYAFDNYFIVTYNGKVGILNDEGKQVISFIYDIIQKVKDKNSLQAIISTSNTIEMYNVNMKKTATISNAVLYTYDNYIKLLSDNDIIYLDNNGNILSNKEIYKENKLFSYSKDDKWGFVDANGNIVVEAQYDIVTEFNECGYAGIKKDGKWGVIDVNGKIIVEPSYKIDWNEPYFINKYCKLNFGYGFEYYTDELEK